MKNELTITYKNGYVSDVYHFNNFQLEKNGMEIHIKDNGKDYFIGDINIKNVKEITIK